MQVRGGFLREAAPVVCLLRLLVLVFWLSDEHRPLETGVYSFIAIVLMLPAALPILTLGGLLYLVLKFFRKV